MHFVILQNIYYKQQLVECFILLHIKFSPSGYVHDFLKFSWENSADFFRGHWRWGSGSVYLWSDPAYPLHRVDSPYSISSPAGTEAGTFLKTYFTFYIFRRPSAITLLDQEKPKHWFSTIFAKKTPQYLYLYLLKLKRSYFSVGLYTVYIFDTNWPSLYHNGFLEGDGTS